MRTIEDYGQLLESYYAFIRPLEHAISKLADPDLVDIHNRLRHQLLEQDIRNITGSDAASIVKMDEPAYIHNHASALGALYVLEGSTLGGKFIVQMIRQRLPLENGYRYFSGYAEHNDAMWSAFTKVLNGDYSAAFQQDAVTAANQTFNLFDQWLHQSLPPQYAHV